MSLGQYNASIDVKNRRFYLGSAITLRKGQVLAYDTAASKTATDPKTRLGVQVCELKAGNVNNFAGIVPDSEVGKTGPCFIELLQPASDEIVDVEVDGTDDVGAGDLLKADVTKDALIKDGAASVGVTRFKALEAQADDSRVVIRCQRV